MAGGARGAYADEEGVVVAIVFDAHDVKEIARGFAFCPKALLGTREECDATFGLGFIESLLVHIAQHEDLVGDGVLDDGGDEAIGGESYHHKEEGE